MLAHIKTTKSEQGNRRGFTIVELLIVIVVIGILAAITIVAYNGIQNRANNTAVQTDIRNFGNKITIFNVDNGRFPGSAADLTSLAVTISGNSYPNHANALTYCMEGSSFAIGGDSKDGVNGWYYSSKSGLKQVAWWPQSSAVTICQGFGMTMASGSYSSWSPPSNTWATGYTTP